MGVMEMAPRGRMADRNVDLAALNDAERGALELLAEGHTVKSIADLTGRSVAAINERLREARRKTGVGSSRELARLLKAQKNRDEKIDLSAARATAAVLEPEDGQRSRGPSRKGWIVMALILIGALAAALIAPEVKQAPAAGGARQAAGHVPPDPLLEASLPSGPPDTAELHDRLRKEERDDAWAREIEPALRGRYSAIPHVNDRGEVRVTCAATLCEVANELPGSDQANEGELKALYGALQSEPLYGDVKKMGLIYQGATFTGSKTKPSRPLFVVYWARWRNDQRRPDALLDGALPKSEHGERRFYVQLRTEARDRVWAETTEAGLQAILAGVPALKGGEHRVRATCAATLCEVTAMTAPGASQPEVDVFFRDLQTYKFSTDIEKLGLAYQMSSFGGPVKGKRTLYVSYWSRNGD